MKGTGEMDRGIGVRAAPLVRANMKITVKNTVCEEASVSAYGILTGNWAFALKGAFRLPFTTCTSDDC